MAKVQKTSTGARWMNVFNTFPNAYKPFGSKNEMGWWERGSQCAGCGRSIDLKPGSSHSSMLVGDKTFHILHPADNHGAVNGVSEHGRPVQVFLGPSCAAKLPKDWLV